MFRIISILFLLVSLMPVWAIANEYNGGWNQYTIMPEDFQNKQAPTFEQYKVPMNFHGKPAPVDIKSNPEAKTWRTRLKEGAIMGPNFADDITIVAWGCGTDCMQIAFVDAKTGKVYFDKKLMTNVAVNVHDKVLNQVLSYRRDSTLLIAAGCPNEECETRRGVNYFIWTGKELKQIFRVPKGWYPKK
jgi:hypothetical protein